MTSRLYMASKCMPRFVVSLLTRILAYTRFKLKSGNRCVIDPKSFFEGNNVLLDDVRIFNSCIGRYTYIASNSRIVNASIGRFCSIGSEVIIKVGMHPTDFVSTHPLFHSKSHSQSLGFRPFLSADKFEPHSYVEEGSNYVVRIGSDVWIGNRVTILDGVTIGDGAIIGTGAVVTKSIPAYQIAAGIPAKPIRYRFSEHAIQTLLSLKWWDKDDDWILARSHLFESLDQFLAFSGEQL